jgi:hypothetical protein
MVGSPDPSTRMSPFRTPEVIVPPARSLVSHRKSGESARRAAAVVKSFMLDAGMNRFPALYSKIFFPFQRVDHQHPRAFSNAGVAKDGRESFRCFDPVVPSKRGRDTG